MYQKEPIEALLRSLLLVLMDNATAEYSFISIFFTPEPSAALTSRDSSNFLLSPTALLSPDRGSQAERQSIGGSDSGGKMQRNRADSIVSIGNRLSIEEKEEQASSDVTWKQILDPVLDYCQVCQLLPTPATPSVSRVV